MQRGTSPNRRMRPQPTTLAHGDATHNVVVRCIAGKRSKCNSK